MMIYFLIYVMGLESQFVKKPFQKACTSLRFTHIADGLNELEGERFFSKLETRKEEKKLPLSILPLYVCLDAAWYLKLNGIFDGVCEAMVWGPKFGLLEKLLFLPTFDTKIF